MTHRRLHPLRAAADRSATAGSSSSPWCSPGPVPADGGAEPGPDARRASRSPTYYMAGMVAWGTMAAVIAGGARIAAERAIGWHRQLRVSPLPVRTYFAAKLVSGYLVAADQHRAAVRRRRRVSACGFGGVHWVEMTVLILIGLMPFAVLGILLGHLLTVDSMGPAIGGHHLAVRPPRRGLGPDGQPAGSPESPSACPRTGWCRRPRPGTGATPGRRRPGSCSSCGPPPSWPCASVPTGGTRPGRERERPYCDASGTSGAARPSPFLGERQLARRGWVGAQAPGSR